MTAISRQFCSLIAAFSVLGICLLAFSFAPQIAQAFPFGGQVNDLIHCANGVTYVTLGAPTPGAYIWSPSTHTYDFGPPSHAGQWLLGLAGAPYFCYVSYPWDIRTGTYIMMMGSSK